MAKTREKWGTFGGIKTPRATVEEVPDEESTLKTQEDAEPIGPQNKPTNQENHSP